MAKMTDDEIRQADRNRLKTAKAAKKTETLAETLAETQQQYRQRIVDMVCAVTICSSKGLPTIVKALQVDNTDIPSEATIRSWIRSSEDLAARYARAKEEQIEVFAEEIIAISDDDTFDIAFKADGTTYVNTEHIQRSKLRVDSRKWLAAKLKPKKYGDKLELAGNADSPLIVQVVQFANNPNTK